LPESKTTHICDGMVQIQMVRDAKVKSFGDLARTHFDILTSPLDASCNTIYVVFDQYKAVSIKGGERNICGAHSAMEITIRSRHTPVPKQLDKYIGHVKNKQHLCQFLCEEWCSLGQKMLQPGHEMVVAGGFADCTRAVLVSNCQHDDIGHLKSDHEEADTRLLLHAKDVSNTHSRIVIHSSDADVCVLCVALYQESNCQELWFRTGI
jgi:hypothetical protein